MNSATWRQAAEVCRRRNEEARRPEVIARQQREAEEGRQKREALAQATQKLASFLASKEWKDAQTLLRESGKYVIVGERNMGGEHVDCYALTEQGLVVRHEFRGTCFLPEQFDAKTEEKSLHPDSFC